MEKYQILGNGSINNRVLCSRNIFWLYFMNWSYGYHQRSAGEPVSTAHRHHQFGPACDVLVVSSLAGDVKCYSSRFAGEKKISQLRYHPSCPAYGALSASVGGSTWHLQTSLITHLPSQIRARQTRGAAPRIPAGAAFVAQVCGKEQSTAFVGEHVQSSTEIRLLELQRPPQTKNKCLCSL